MIDVEDVLRTELPRLAENDALPNWDIWSSRRRKNRA